MTAPERISELERQLHWAQLKIQALEQELRQRRIQQLGPRSETLSDLQLELLAEEEPGATRDEVEAEARREPITKRERRPHPGRKPLPAHLPRLEEVIRCADTCCAACGEETAIIGTTKASNWMSSRRAISCASRGARSAAAGAARRFRAAPLKDRIVEKGLASDAVVMNTVVAKYSDHMPLYRQAVMIERETGIETGRATLDGWVMRVGELLVPVVQSMRRELLAASYLQADETPVPVLETEKVLQHKRASRRVYSRLDPYGYRRDGDTLIAVPVEQDVITRISLLRANGWSLRKIADVLNSDGVPTKQGSRWYAMTVKDVLDNPLHKAA